MIKKYVHNDGSRCELRLRTWVVTKVRTPKMGSGPIEEKVGDPCPYCNKYPEDATGLVKLESFWVQYVVHTPGWALYLMFLGALALFFSLMLGAGILLPPLIGAGSAFLIWGSVRFFIWHRGRNGQPDD